jgi:hypothetical protein
MGQAAQLMVANDYKADGMVRKIERIYLDLLDRKGI